MSGEACCRRLADPGLPQTLTAHALKYLPLSLLAAGRAVSRSMTATFSSVCKGQISHCQQLSTFCGADPPTGRHPSHCSWSPEGTRLLLTSQVSDLAGSYSGLTLSMYDLLSSTFTIVPQPPGSALGVHWLQDRQISLSMIHSEHNTSAGHPVGHMSLDRVSPEDGRIQHSPSRLWPVKDGLEEKDPTGNLRTLMTTWEQVRLEQALLRFEMDTNRLVVVREYLSSKLESKAPIFLAVSPFPKAFGAHTYAAVWGNVVLLGSPEGAINHRAVNLT
ncbi:hypothetical protein WJX84_001191 [Apatococcus fuscideae]|uniref:Uncharacterized protein n=1 Tax=Apatococcus fuscideae TaxID=2026836 RepID=A0AAW1THW1_9CHLO